MHDPMEQARAARPPASSNQQSTINNHQSSIINHQSSIINHQSDIPLLQLTLLRRHIQRTDHGQPIRPDGYVQVNLRRCDVFMAKNILNFP